MTSGISLSILGFAFGILGSSLSCCNRSWVTTCTTQTLACIFMLLATGCLGSMAIVFPYMFEAPTVEDINNKNYNAYNTMLKEYDWALPDNARFSQWKDRATLPYTYGMSLYLCWASMVLSGVAVAIYAFATCLLCAEYKLLREKRHYLDDGSGMYYQNSSQKMVTGSNRSNQNSQKQTKNSQKSNSGKNPGYKYSEVSNHVASTHTTPSSKCNTLQFWH